MSKKTETLELPVPKVEVKKQETTYSLRIGGDGVTAGVEMQVEVTSLGRITIQPQRGSEFVFRGSNPDMVATIGHLLLVAAELGHRQEKEDEKKK